MFTKKTKVLVIALLCIGQLQAYEMDCSSIFEHESDQKDGRITTVVSDQGALLGLENCETTNEEFVELDTVNKGSQLDYKVITRNFTKAQRNKLMIALSKLKLVINSNTFRSKVLAHYYNGSNTYANNGGMNNSQIYNKFMSGAERLFPRRDKKMDLDITMYYEDTNVVGYTYQNTPRIWVNSKFFNSFSYASIAGNITHEWLHKVGFVHDFESTARRPYSVPYAVGKILRRMVR